MLEVCGKFCDKFCGKFSAAKIGGKAETFILLLFF